VVLAGLIACGGNSSPTSPSGGGVGSSGSPGASGATITIGANGAVSPSQVTIAVGQSVTFVNNNTRGHQIASDPHPSHTNCPSINALATIAAGQTRLTNGFSGAGSCGFHDHNEPDNNGLKGRITIQ
jgi:plastocyanin